MTFSSKFKMAVPSFALLFLLACSEQPATPATEHAMPAPQVDVAKVISQRITEWDSFTGRLESPHRVSLRPRVSGYIDKVSFAEGTNVNQGDVLFVIDQAPYQEQVNRLAAQLVQVKSQLTLATTDYNRVVKLRKSKSVSQEEVDNRYAAMQQANASVKATQAQLALAKLDLGYTEVKAPIAGKISRALITEGNYVTAGNSILTNIVSTETLYAYFDVDEQTFLNYKDLEKASQHSSEHSYQQPVAMKLANDANYEFWGQLDFVDNSIDATTGTIRVRASFINEDGYLMPGMFAHIKVAASSTYQGVLVDEKAIGTDLNNKFVMVLTQDNSVQYRAVQLGDKVNGMRLIQQGLEAGDTIVVNGLQRIRPGAVVNPKMKTMASKQQVAEISAWQQRLDEQVSLANRANPQGSSAGI